MLGNARTLAGQLTAIDEADLILLFVARSTNRQHVQLCVVLPSRQIIHIDASVPRRDRPKNVSCSHPRSWANASSAPAKPAGRLPRSAIGAEPRQLYGVVCRIEGWREKYPLGY